MRKLLLLIALLGGVASSFGQCDDSTLTNGLVAYYPFNADVNDYSGYTNNGQYITYNSTNTNAVYGTGRLGEGCLLFDGLSSVQVNAANLNLTNITLTVWVKPTADGVQGDRYILHRDSPGNNNGSTQWHIGWNNVTPPGYNRFYSRFVFNQNPNSDIATPALSTNNWYQVVSMFDGTNQSLYINGTLVSNNQVTGFTLKYVASNMIIGMLDSQTANGFIGSINDIRIYNRALSSNEITALYNLESGSSWVSFFSSTLPTNSVFYSSLAANTEFATALAATITSNPSIYGLFIGQQGTQGLQGIQGPAGPQGPVGVFDPTVLTNTSFLNSLASNTTFVNALASNPVFLRALAQSLTTTNTDTNYGIASKGIQKLTFAAIPPQTYKPLKKIILNAISSAKLPITYTCANHAIGTINGRVLQLEGSGTTTVTATQAGSQYDNPASATQTLIVH